MTDREKTRRRMEALLGRWQDSGMPLSQFARQNGVTRDQLEYWKRLLLKTPEPSAASTPDHVVRESEPAVEVVLANGDRLIVRTAVTPDHLAALIRAMRPTC